MTVSKQIFGNLNTIYDCCTVLCHIQFFLGCSGIIKHNHHNYKSNRKSLLYTWLAVISFTVGLTGTMFIKLQDPSVYKLDSLIKSIIYLEVAMSVFMYLVTVLTMLSNITTHLELYRHLHDLDTKLVKKFSCKLNYEKLIKKHIVLVTSVAIIYITVIVAAVSQASHGQEFIVNLVAGLAYTAVTGGPHLNGYAQMNMAEILSIRFRLLQKLLRRKVICSSKLTAKQQIENLRCLIDMVQEYHNCIRSINKVFSFGLVTTMLHDFTLTTSELYLIFGGSAAGNPAASSLIFYVAICMLLPLYKMTIAPIYCDKAIKEVIFLALSFYLCYSEDRG